MSLRTWWKQLQASNEELAAVELLEDTVVSGATLIDELATGDVVTLKGKVRSLVLRPEIKVPAFEVDLYDGSGSLAVVFMGRRTIAGIEPGTTLAVTGRVVRQENGFAMFNPTYSLLSQSSK